MVALEVVNDRRTPFTALIGATYTHLSADRVEAEMLVRPDMCTAGNTCHGGALMSFADTMGATATSVNTPEGAGTTTMESKTNFLRAAPEGAVLHGVCTAVHKGRRTQVWRSEIFREDGKLVAVVTQTQMVLRPQEG